MGQPMKMLSYGQLCFICVLFSLYSTPVSSRLCTVLRNKKTINTHTKQEPCIQSYKTDCSWFSSQQCTFYEHVMCTKTYNVTKTAYLIVTECCPGYKQLPNRTCIKSDEHVDNLDTEDEGIPHGVFAGIACGALFIICVTVLIVIHIKKNEKKKIIMNKQNIHYKDERVKMLSTVSNNVDPHMAAVPLNDVAAVPLNNIAAVPLNNAAAVPSINAAAVPSINAAAVP